MRVWFMVGALVLGVIGVWGQQGRGSRVQQPVNGGNEGTVSAQDGSGPIPTPYAPFVGGSGR